MIRGNEKFLSQVYALADVIVIEVAFLFSYWIKFESSFLTSEQMISYKSYYPWSIIYSIIAVFIGFLLKLYFPKRKNNFYSEASKVLQVHILSLLLLISILFVLKEVDISRGFLAIFLVNGISFIVIYRYVVKNLLKRIRKKGYNSQFVLILGAGSLGRRFHENLNQYPSLGFKIVGFLDDYQEQHDEQYSSFEPIVGKVSDLESTLEKKLVDEVIIALPITAYSKFLEIINICEKAGVRAMIIPDYFDILPSKPHFENFAGVPLINVRDIPLDELGNRFVKRSFDIFFSLLAILVLLPLLVVIAIGVKITSPGPIIFKQERVGLNRRNFHMYKFRSMKVLSQNSSDTQWTIANDPRKTRFGSFLRKTSIDELPQFFNVLFGHMSVVGPRPERPFFVEQFKEEIPKYMVKHHIRPGITGWAQASGLRGDTSIEERIRHDIFYIENWTFLFDIKIIWKTVVNGFINKNAY